MNLLNAFGLQLQAAWQRYDARQRALLSVVAAVAIAAVVGVGFWSARSEYVPLANQLSPAKAAELVGALQSAGIPHELSYSGSEVLVPKQDWSRARLAAGEMIDPLQSSGPDLEDGLFADPSLNRYRLLKNQEDTLARSIMRLRGVAQATVHISRPEASPFLRDEKPTTASVVLDVKPGAEFERQQAAAVVAMVSHAVEGLDPNDITLLDTTGRILSQGVSALGSDVGVQLDYRRRIETDLAAKAETMLSQLLGPGRAVVRVTADVDFTQTTRKEVTFDPDAKVKISEKIMTKNSSGQPGGATNQVPAGTASNVSPPASGAAGGNSTKEETIDTTYANAEITNNVTEAAGRIRRLTVSAAVDIPQPTADAGGTAPPALTKEQLEAVIKQAVGFSTVRSDQIEVVVGQFAALQTPDPVITAGPIGWQQYEGLVRNASLGIASLVMLAIALMTLRKIRPVVVESSHGEGLSPESARRLNSMTQQVADDPEAVAQVIQAWLGDDQKSANSTATRQVRKVA